MLPIYHITLSTLYIHACINEIFDSIWREIGFHILRGNPFFALLLRSSVILGECTMTCALLFPTLVSVLLFFLFFFLFLRVLFQDGYGIIRETCSKMFVSLDSLGVLLVVQCTINVYCYCLSKPCFQNLKHDGIDDRSE